MRKLVALLMALVALATWVWVPAWVGPVAIGCLAIASGDLIWRNIKTGQYRWR